jgi:hypothetical protein
MSVSIKLKGLTWFPTNREDRPQEHCITYKGHKITVSFPGWDYRVDNGDSWNGFGTMEQAIEEAMAEINLSEGS